MLGIALSSPALSLGITINFKGTKAECLSLEIYCNHQAPRCEPGPQIKGKNLFSGSDVRDFYYLFSVTEERCRRNVLQGAVKPSEVSHLACFRPEFWEEPLLHAGLATLAMGDSQAVGLAQTCHVGLALQSHVATPSNLLSLKGPLPRLDTMVGIVIDDFVTISRVPKNLDKPSDGSQLADKMESSYIEVGLIPHKDKSFRDSEKATFWGADLNGDSGMTRGALRRAIPLMSIILQIERLGYATVEILQTVAGSLVSLYLFRRRLLSLLDAIFQSCSGRSARSIVRLSGRARGELLFMAAMLPFAATNLRAGFLPRVTASDASNWGEAGVYAEVPCNVSAELCRHSLRRSVWAKLLPPGKAWERSHDRLSPELELPEDVRPFESNPLWEILATSLRYRLLYSRRTPKPRHINIGEVRSMLESEKINGFRFPGCRGLFCLDSQVALGCIGKGRSSSPSLNWELARSVPNMLGLDSYSELAYFMTQINPSDAPTRGRKIPRPLTDLPSWWDDLASSLFDRFDEWLSSVGLDSHSVSELPPFEELFGPHCTEEGPALSKQSQSFRADAPDETSINSPDTEHKDPGLKAPEQSSEASTPEVAISSTEVCEASATALPVAPSDLDPPIISSCQRDFEALPMPKEDDFRLNFLSHLGEREKQEVRSFLQDLDAEQIHLHHPSSWPPSKPGFLDLYSGAKRCSFGHGWSSRHLGGHF